MSSQSQEVAVKRLRDRKGIALTNLTKYASWGYLLFVAALWMLVFIAGDRWWPATFVLFAPRWIAVIPLMVLVPLAICYNRFGMIPLLLGAFVVIGPFMGFNLPSGRSGNSGAAALRVLSCNLASGNIKYQSLITFINETAVDVVVLQECPREVNLKLKVLSEWHFFQDGGLAVLSKYPLRDPKSVQALHPPHKWPRTCLLQCSVTTPVGEVTINNVHLPSPRYGLQTLLDRKTFFNLSRKSLLITETANRWRVAREVQGNAAMSSQPSIVAGDFNMPIESAIYRTVWGNYANAFSKAGFGYGWTERSMVRGVPIAVRIDHVLTNGGLVAHVCTVGPDVGSDHLPLMADIELVKR